MTVSSPSSILRADEWIIDQYRQSFMNRADLILAEVDDARQQGHPYIEVSLPSQPVFLKWFYGSAVNRHLVASMLAEITGTQSDEMEVLCDISVYQKPKGWRTFFFEHEHRHLPYEPLGMWMKVFAEHEGDEGEQYSQLDKVYFAVKV